MTSPYYTLFLSADSCNEEGIRTLMVMGLGGKRTKTVNEKTGSAIIAFARKKDRDDAKIWALGWAHQNGLHCEGVI